MDTETIASSRVSKMLEYINDKYADTFTYIGPYGGYTGSTTHKIIISSRKFPGREICVVSSEGSGRPIYSDNYVAVKYESQTKQCLTDLLSECLGPDLFVSYGASTLACSSVFNDETTFSEFITEPSSAIHFTAITGFSLTDRDRDQLVSALEEKFVSVGLCCGGKIYFCSDFEGFGSLTDENYYSTCLKDDAYDASLYINMSSSAAFEKARWEEPNG